MDAEYLKSILEYSPELGTFTYLKTVGAIRAGRIAGATKSNGYRQICIEGKIYLAHRLAWLYMTGEWPKDQIDHRNRIKTDNRWDNLREATHSENMFNIKSDKNATGHQGVYQDREPYGFYFQVRVGNGKRICRGGFATAQEASNARKKIVNDVHGEFSVYSSDSSTV